MTLEANLTSAITRTGRAIAHLRDQARQHNQPEWSVDILALLDLADEYQAAHTPEYQIDMVADHYDLILVKARDIPFPDDELETDGRSGALYGAVGQLIGAADGIMRAAAALGKQPTAATHKLPEKIEIDRSSYRRELDALIDHVREVREMVRERVEPEAVAPDHGPLERAIIGNYVNEMQLTDKSIHITVSIGDGIDLAVLERFVSRLASATREMIDSVKSWPGAAAKRVRVGIEAVRKPVSRAVGSVGGLILKLVRADGKGAVPVPAPPPIPEDFLEQARTMILAGDAPPEHWSSLILKLDFRRTDLASLAPLARLTSLQSLDLCDTQISEISTLAGLNLLKNLELKGTQVSDISVLAGLTSLRTLTLWNTKISDIKPLSGLTGLRKLDLMGTDIGDIRPLANLNDLISLDLWNTKISDITPLTNLTKLQHLDLGLTNLSDIKTLARLTSLQSLNLEVTQVSDIAPLAGLTALESLALEGTQVSDITSLASLTALESLTLENSLVSDITPLAGLTALESLNLWSCQVSDITPLAGLTALKSLDLRYTQVSDIACLSDSINLEIIAESQDHANSLRGTLKFGSKVKVKVDR